MLCEIGAKLPDCAYCHNWERDLPKIWPTTRVSFSH